ncbi:MAG: DEAD/DEAH box helicase, partial [Pseudomonadota bacterium]|nr:DEAD/DEAH box helicase [Pseudomonadota bacterium]
MLHGQELAEWFAKESPLESTLEGFAPRLGQGEMAQAISDSILNGQSLIVEAGTGIGKTLAYLIPVLLSDHRVILSTGTKTLQDQLFYRDLPVVTDSIGRPSKTVLLKGRSNYLCLHRLDAAQNASLGAELAKDLNNIVSWSQRTRTGDIVEVDDLSEDSSIWQQVTSTQENCLGAKCDFYDQCYIVSA